MRQNLLKILFPTIFCSFLFLITSIAAAQEPIWLTKLKQQKWMDKVSRLELLKTTRVEAENIFGKSDEKDGQTSQSVHYEVAENKVILDFTTKQCTSAGSLVSRDTVSAIFLTLDDKISFSKLGLPLKEFKYSHSSDTPAEFYENEETGITLSVMDDQVETVSFEIPQRSSFSCVTVSSLIVDLNKIKELKLLETNKDQIEKIFAGYQKEQSDKGAEHTLTYHTDDAVIKFSFSKGKCEFDDFEGYKTAEGLLERINVSPVNSIKPEEFGISLAGYQKEQRYQNDGDFYIYYQNEPGISFEVSGDSIDEINFFTSPKYTLLLCDQERAKATTAAPGLFPNKLADRILYTSSIAYVERLYIDRTEITAEELSGDTTETARLIRVSTQTVNPRNDVLTYNYTVTGGKITGQGAKVIWDLTGVKAGTYQITSGVDDGCGVCGPIKSRTIVVREPQK